MIFRNSKLAQKVKFKKRQFEQFPFCPRCGVKMIFKNFGPTAKIPDNLVTLEHVFTRNPQHKKMRPGNEKGKIPDGQRRWMILCHKCNREKGIEEVRKVPKIIWWIKCKHFPWYLDFFNRLMKLFRDDWFTTGEIWRRVNESKRRRMQNAPEAIAQYGERFFPKKEDYHNKLTMKKSMFQSKEEKSKITSLKEQVDYANRSAESYKRDLQNERQDRALEKQRMEQDKQLALKEKEFEIKHFKDEDIKALKEQLEASAKENAVLRKENEMLVKITDLNADVIDVKGLVKDLIGKLPSINISGLSVNSHKDDNAK